MPFVNIDFYAVRTPDKKHHFQIEPILEEVGNLPSDQRLINRGPEYSDYIELLDISRDQYFGGAARIRRMGLPRKFDLRTIQGRDLGLSPDEGLEETAYFLYDVSLKTLALQRHRLFRSTSWERLVKELSHCSFCVEPKRRKDMWNRFKHLGRVGSIEVTVENPDHYPGFSDVQPSFGRLLNDASKEVDALRIELKMSVSGARKRSLNMKWVQKFVSRLRTEEAVEKLSVTGTRVDDGRRDVINFMRERLAFSQEVEYSTRAIGEESCHQLLRQAIDANKEYLTHLL